MTTKNPTTIPNFFVSSKQPYIVRGGWFDAMGGMLVGNGAETVCKMLNAYLGVAKLVTSMEATIEETKLGLKNMRAPLDQNEELFVHCAGIRLEEAQKHLEDLVAAVRGEER
jgi:hypothetical protein